MANCLQNFFNSSYCTFYFLLEQLLEFVLISKILSVNEIISSFGNYAMILFLKSRSISQNEENVKTWNGAELCCR